MCSKDIHLPVLDCKTLIKLKMKVVLEQRQNKNDTIWSIRELILKFPPFFTARIGE